jgi:nicotinamidase-related amidase
MSELRLKVRHYRIFPQRHFLGHQEEEITIDGSRTAFVVVDVYGLGFSPEDGTPHPLASLSSWTPPEEAAVTVGKIRPALDAARAAGLPIVYVSNSGPRIGLAKSEFGKVLKRTADMNVEELFAEENVDPREYHYGPSPYLKHSKVIAPQVGDYYIRKLYYSGFQDTRLDALLRHLAVRTLIFVGYAIDCCLQCTMIDALYRNYEVLFLRDCTLADVERLPEERPGGMGFTERMVIWAETNVGRSATSEDFIRACRESR